MNIINLKIIYKALLKNKFYSILSILGIALTFIFLCITFILVHQKKGNIAPEVNKDKTISFHGFLLENGDWKSVDSLMATYYMGMKTPEYIAYVNGEGPTIYHNGQAIWLTAGFVAGDYFKIFEFKLLSGRTFSKEESQLRQAVITETFAKRFFKRTDVVGEKIEMQSETYAVIGVVQDPYFTSICNYDIYIPYTFDKFVPQRNMEHKMFFMAKDKASIASISDEINRMNQQFQKQGILNAPPIMNNWKTMDKDVNTSLVVSISGLIAILMLIPAFNILSLNTGRIADQQQELAIKKAYGASRGRIVRELLFENLVTTLLGVVLGLLLTKPFIKLIEWFINLFTVGPFKMSFNMSIDTYVIIAILAFAILFSLLSSYYPALRISRQVIIEGLKGGKS